MYKLKLNEEVLFWGLTITIVYRYYKFIRFKYLDTNSSVLQRISNITKYIRRTQFEKEYKQNSLKKCHLKM